MEPHLIPTYDGAYRRKDMTYLFLLSQQINNSCVFTPDTEEQGGAMQTHRKLKSSPQCSSSSSRSTLDEKTERMQKREREGRQEIKGEGGK